jgi:chaperone modulatory protein CbpM
MAHVTHLVFDTVVVEEEISFTLHELSHVCRADSAQLIALVEAGALEPAGTAPDEWRFAGPALRRARMALRLTQDLELNASATALVLDLTDRIAALESRLARAGVA